MRHALTLHPSLRRDPVTSLEVEVAATGTELALTYRLTGDLSRIVVPEAAAAARVDGLWEHTCLEAFIGHGDAYAEFNFAPSGQWAAYGFDGYRQGMTPLDTSPPRIETVRSGTGLEVRVVLPRPDGSRLGLTAVIEAVDGRRTYWALAHPAAQPDFHHAGGLVLAL